MRNESFPGVQPSSEAHIVIGEVNEVCLMTTAKYLGIIMSGSWVIDSACTSHMTFDRSNFFNCRKATGHSIEMGTKAKAIVAGVEDVLIDDRTSSIIKPTNVLHTPSIGYELLCRQARIYCSVRERPMFNHKQRRSRSYRCVSWIAIH